MRSLSPNQTPTSSPFLLSSQNRKDQKKVQKLEAQIPYHEGYVVLIGSYWRVCTLGWFRGWSSSLPIAPLGVSYGRARAAVAWFEACASTGGSAEGVIRGHIVASLPHPRSLRLTPTIFISVRTIVTRQAAKHGRGDQDQGADRLDLGEGKGGAGPVRRMAPWEWAHTGRRARARIVRAWHAFFQLSRSFQEVCVEAEEVVGKTCTFR
jgi:hypothetical protein